MGPSKVNPGSIFFQWNSQMPSMVAWYIYVTKIMAIVYGKCTWIFLWCLFSASNLRGKNLRRLILKTPPNPKNASSYSPSWELMRVRVCLLQDWIICISFWFSVVKGPCARKYNLSGMLSWMNSRCKWQTNSLSHNQKETSILLPTTSSTSKHWLWGSRRCKPNAVAGDYLLGQ